MSDGASDPVDQLQIIITGPARSSSSSGLPPRFAGAAASGQAGSGSVPRPTTTRPRGQAVNFAA
ncbi:hypothetical protein BAL199_21794 [alpha proteobacterium BAL199]|jgi:hypothetical protein|nr:hypothetical protein BAL199_21794 [alpha proteobacterium BAL199]